MAPDLRGGNSASVSGFVTERLAEVAREICAVLERLVAGYEEEASGFRQEIARQRRQLELLQKQQQQAAAADGTPAPAPTAGGPPAPTLTRERRSCSGVQRSGKLGPGGQEDEPPDNRDGGGGGQRVQSDRRIPGRPRISQTRSHVDLRIRVLEDPQTRVLSNDVLKKCPAVELQCPRRLQEEDFLPLLRSTCSPLAGNDTPFDVLISDKRRRLQPLQLRTLTPEEILRNLRCSGWRSTLYIRPRASQERSHPPQTSAMSTSEQATPPTSDLPAQDGGSGQERGEEAAEPPSGMAGPAGDRSHGKKEEELAATDDDGDWKPDGQGQRGGGCGPPSKKQKQQANIDALDCKACGALQTSEAALVRHAWSHADHPEHVCGVCGVAADVLKEHLQSRHETADCPVCGESFLCVFRLDEHMAAHSAEKPHRCDVCHQAFALKAALQRHRQRLHQAGKPHRCHTCHKAFEQEEELEAHRRTHAGRQSNLCGVCGKSLSDYRSLSRHKMTHSGERPHGCQVCGRRFKLIGTLRQHEKIHTARERSYLCDVCCKMFLTSKELQVHMRQHTNERPYHCGECGKAFTTKWPLTAHMRVHTGETPYRCPHCGWSFKRKIHLDNHVTVHSGLKPFVCGICGKACARKAYLTVHMRTHSGERPYRCSVCDKAFTQSHCLKTHMKSHQAATT